jgi:hypothetical protein
MFCVIIMEEHKTILKTMDVKEEFLLLFKKLYKIAIGHNFDHFSLHSLK